jgi:hypothetical protein
MKWTEEELVILRRLISEGKKHYEISLLLGRTEKSVENKCSRLRLKIVSYERGNCKRCNSEFVKLLSSPQVFCSSSCAAIFNKRLKGARSEETKIKISKTLKSKNIRPPQKIKSIKSIKSTVKRVCKNCKKENKLKNGKLICDDCVYKYYELYRPSCSFKFNVLDYIDEFELDLVEKHGWYSPTNKRNNLSGVSKDHIYSVKDGYVNNILPEIMSHPANCRLMIHKDNSSKNSKSDISIDELLSRILVWNNKYG